MVRGSWVRIPTITTEARQALWECAGALNEYVGPDHAETQLQKPREHGVDYPGDHYNARVTQEEVLALLERHGWTTVYSRGSVNYLCRPGKLNGISATLGHVAPKTFYVFSTNACPFAGPHRDHDGNDRLGTAYDPFGIYARLKHGGDFAAAAKALAAQRYGDPWRTIAAQRVVARGGIRTVDAAEVMAWPQ
jgi:putative DNA primase/helicase